MANVVNHIGCEIVVLYLCGKREGLAGVVFEDLGEVSLCDPFVRIAEISCVLCVCICGYLLFSFTCVCEKREYVIKMLCGVSEMLRRCVMSKILVTSPFSHCNEA